MTTAANLFASLKGDEEQEVIPLKVNENAPANKNMETQPRYYSTKKRCHKAKVQLAHPTHDKQHAFLRDIKENRGRNANLRIEEGKCYSTDCSCDIGTFHMHFLFNKVDGHHAL